MITDLLFITNFFIYGLLYCASYFTLFVCVLLPDEYCGGVIVWETLCICTMLSAHTCVAAITEFEGMN